jgi:hypothetical protein
MINAKTKGAPGAQATANAPCLLFAFIILHLSLGL